MPKCASHSSTSAFLLVPDFCTLTHKWCSFLPPFGLWVSGDFSNVSKCSSSENHAKTQSFAMAYFFLIHLKFCYRGNSDWMNDWSSTRNCLEISSAASETLQLATEYISTIQTSWVQRGPRRASGFHRQKPSHSLTGYNTYTCTHTLSEKNTATDAFPYLCPKLTNFKIISLAEWADNLQQNWSKTFPPHPKASLHYLVNY